MIEVWKLTKRHIDKNEKLPQNYRQIVVFSTCTGHGIGTIDFSEKIAEFSDEMWENFVGNDEMARFKLGNIHKYFEVEILASQAKILREKLPPSPFREILENLNEGYIVLKKRVK